MANAGSGLSKRIQSRFPTGFASATLAPGVSWECDEASARRQARILGQECRVEEAFLLVAGCVIRCPIRPLLEMAACFSASIACSLSRITNAASTSTPASRGQAGVPIPQPAEIHPRYLLSQRRLDRAPSPIQEPQASV